MSKKSIILIGIVLAIVAVMAFVFFSFYKPTQNTNTGTTGTNFLSNIFPFGKSTNTNTGTPTPPADVSGYVAPIKPEAQRELLTKVSTMPIAGYTVFMKERFKEIVQKTPEITDPSLILPLAGEEGLVPPAKGDSGGLNTSKTASKTPTVKPTAPLTEFVPNLRYIEKATGNIYQTFADIIDERKFTTTIIPTVYDAYFGDSGNSVIMRYLKEDGNTIETFAGTTPVEILGADSSVPNEIKGSFLPENITDISVSPNNSSVFYLFDNGESAFGITASSSGNKKNQIFSSPFTEWLSGWPNDRMITLNTKPSFSVEGFMYSIDPNTKKINKIIGGVNGLTTLTSPSGKLVLYNNNTLTLRVYNTTTNDSISLGIKTMPEKCVWNKDSTLLYCAVPKYISGSNYPDTWYQGEISFSDDIWKINVENGSAVDIADPTSFTKGEEIDGIKLSLDGGENYLFFVNKKDSYLWELNLK